MDLDHIVDAAETGRKPEWESPFGPALTLGPNMAGQPAMPQGPLPPLEGGMSRAAQELSQDEVNLDGEEISSEEWSAIGEQANQGQQTSTDDSARHANPRHVSPSRAPKALGTGPTQLRE